MVTNSSGAVAESTAYYPYGATRTGSITTTEEQFTGQRLDGTGLYFYNARYYDPNIGRFISADTIVQNYRRPGTFNRYTYTLDNPLKYVDPSGNVLWLAEDLAGPPGDTQPSLWQQALDKAERAGELMVDTAKQGVTRQGEAIKANMEAERAAGEEVVETAGSIASATVRAGHEVVDTVVQNQEVVVLAGRTMLQNPTGMANDTLGLGLAAASGGDVSISSDGVVVVENAGGPAGAFMDTVNAPAFTVGHAVFSEGALPESSPTYAHEEGHVEQYEMLGGAFLPAYAGAQVVAEVIAWITGGDPHDYNLFEMWADW